MWHSGWSRFLHWRRSMIVSNCTPSTGIWQHQQHGQQQQPQQGQQHAAGEYHVDQPQMIQRANTRPVPILRIWASRITHRLPWPVLAAATPAAASCCCPAAAHAAAPAAALLLPIAAPYCPLLPCCCCCCCCCCSCWSNNINGLSRHRQQ